MNYQNFVNRFKKKSAPVSVERKRACLTKIAGTIATADIEDAPMTTKERFAFLNLNINQWPDDRVNKVFDGLKTSIV